MAFWPASARKRVAMPATIFVGLVRAGSPTVLAEKGDRFSSRDEVFLTINEILSSDERLPMPIQVVRDALTEHYVDGDGRLFWVGSPRMGQLIERLRNAEDDGLFSRDYPEEYLVSLQEELKAGNAFTEAYAELAFSAFFLRYASDLKIGRFVPRRIDPELYVSRKKMTRAKRWRVCGMRAIWTRFSQAGSRKARNTIRYAGHWENTAPSPKMADGGRLKQGNL